VKKIYVTLDTEMDSDEHWIKHYPATYTSVTEGIPRFLRPIWDRYGVNPIYYVSPEILYDEEAVKVLQDEIEKGAIIGAHLHPEYIAPDNIFGAGMEKAKAKFPCIDYDMEQEKEKLTALTALIKEKLGVTPIWYRAARFGTDIDTIHILKELGYQYDSSVTPHISWSSKGGPDHSHALEQPYVISEEDLYRESVEDKDANQIKEVPVTILGKRWGVFGKLLPDNWLFYRWLRPTHMTYLELKNVINQMVREERKESVMMFHSMEIMVNKTPYVRTKWMQDYYLWRLDKILRYASQKGFQFH